MAHRKIMLVGDPIVHEIEASEAITPGHLLLMANTGKVKKHDSAGDNVSKMVALEREELGKEIGDAYANADIVKVGVYSPGMRGYLLVAAAAPAIVIGDMLEAAADGTVRKVVADATIDQTERDSTVGFALEAVDNSGGGAAVRIRVQFV